MRNVQNTGELHTEFWWWTFKK